LVAGFLRTKILLPTYKLSSPKMEQQDNKKKFYKRWWFWAIVVVVVLIALGSGSSGQSQTSGTVDASTSAQATKQPSVPAEYKAALNKATEYANTMRMSKKGVYLQLTSDYGEKFTPEAAQYAIDNVKADWNANALAKAKDYQNSMSMSPAKIHDQLTSSYGEKFTEAEADYAIQHLND